MGSTFGHEYEDGILGAEKKSPDEHGVALATLPVLNRQSSRTRPNHTYSPSSSSAHVNESSARYSAQHSIDSSAVHQSSSRESGQGSDMLRSHSMSTTYSLSNTIDPSSTLFPPPSSSSNASNPVRRQSVGKKRKPAPIYKPSEDGHSTSAILSNPVLQHSTNTEPSFPELSHKNSFGPGGIEGKPLHYLIPDMPLQNS